MDWPFLQGCVERELLDRIDLFFAQRMLAQTDSRREDVAALLALMMANHRRGHVCSDFSGQPDQEDSLFLQLRELALQGQKNLPEKLCQTMAEDELIPLKPICCHGNRFYFQRSWVFEAQFLQHYLRLSEGVAEPAIELEQEQFILNLEQRKAVEQGLRCPVSLITGGPGTGKTFTAGHLVKAFLKRLSSEQRKQFRVILAAPTGKAVTHLEKQIASVLTQLGLLEEETRQILRSGTLHALLQLREDGSQRTGVVLFADLIIVDECSMIDAKMSALLLSAIPSGTRLVLIGDKDQLPAVESGCFFADLIEAGCSSTVLKQSRRVENPDLTAFAEAISQGKVSEVVRQLPRFLISEKEALLSGLVRQVQASSPFFFPSPPDSKELLEKIGQFQILSCLRKGLFGVEAINRLILESFYSQLPADGWWAIPIMIAKNDYALELYNGDTGILLKKVSSENRLLRMGKEDYAIFKGREAIAGLALPAFEYAYCMSVHKSQGSEYEAVALLAPEGAERFGREIFYTGVTRARKTLKVYAQLETIEMMLKKSVRKQSGLTARLSNCRRPA